MKRLIVVMLFIGSMHLPSWATTSAKGETAHPVYGHKFTYE